MSTLGVAVTRAYCTLFDVNYLTRGITLYRSLEQQSSEDFRLWAFCMDEPTETVLRRLQLPSLEVVPLTSLEAHDPALRGTKDDRTQVEYCWTATPAVCRYVLETEPTAESVTYLDADLLFFDDPRLLFDEIADNAVAITPHRYALPYQAKEETSGTYNVSWVTFTRDEDGLAALAWWHERCIEWCYARVRGRQTRRPEIPRVVSDALSARARARAAGSGPRAMERQRPRALRRGRRCAGRRTPARLLPLPFSARIRRDGRGPRGRGAGAASRRCAAGRSLLGQQLPGVRTGAEARLDAVPHSSRHRRAGGRRVAPGFAQRRLATRYRCSHDESLAARIAGLGRSTLRGSCRARCTAIETAGRVGRSRRKWAPSSTANWRSSNATRLRSLPYRAFLELLPALLEDHELRQPASFLDIGCGIGAYSELLTRYAPGRFDYVGADYADEMLEAARKRWPGRRFENHDLYEAGALDGFDVVFASAVIDVMPDPDRALDIFLGSSARWAIVHRQQINERGPRVKIVPATWPAHVPIFRHTGPTGRNRNTARSARSRNHPGRRRHLLVRIPSRRLLTLVSIPKPFVGLTAAIQRNALRSWAAVTGH